MKTPIVIIHGNGTKEVIGYVYLEEKYHYLLKTGQLTLQPLYKTKDGGIRLDLIHYYLTYSDYINYANKVFG